MNQITPEMKDELELLLKFPNQSLDQGLKIHNDAEPAMIEAAGRLFQKGIITQADGGYLTHLGHDLQEHATTLITALKGH